MTGKKFFQVGGALDEAAPSYIERPADTKLIAALEQNELCLVLAPRQTGKSSLMYHAAARLEAKGIRTGIVDLQSLELEETATADTWYGDMIFQIERSLRLTTSSIRWWADHRELGPSQRLMLFLEDVVLAELGEDRVVIFFDEIESALLRPFSEGFFTTLRSLYNARAGNETLRRLNFVLLGMTSAADFIKERRRTPFNVGTPIHLGDFDQKSAASFRSVLGEASGPLMERIFYWTNGQPFLVQRLANAAYRWSVEERTGARLDQEVETVFFHGKIEDDKDDTHFRYIQAYLLDPATPVRKTLRTYARVLTAPQVTADDRSVAQARLKLGGVVRVEEQILKSRNRIYERIFNITWVREHLPRETEKNVLRITGAVFAAVVLWIWVVQPTFFPRLSRSADTMMEKYTPDPTVELQLPVNDVSSAFLDGHSIASPRNGLLRARIAGLPRGLSIHTLELIGGLLRRRQRIPIRVTYYPNWEMKQFPSVDPRFEAMSPLLTQTSEGLELRDVRAGVAEKFLAKDVLLAAISRDKKVIIATTATKDLLAWEARNPYEKKDLLAWEARNPYEKFGQPTGEAHPRAIAIATAPGTNASQDSAPDEKISGIAVVGGDNGTISVWRVSKHGENSPTPLVLSRAGKVTHRHDGGVRSLALTADGKTIFSGGADHLFRRSAIGSSIGEWTGREHDSAITAVDCDANGELALSGDERGEVILWDGKTGQPRARWSESQVPVVKVALSPAGNAAGVVRSDATIEVRSLTEGDKPWLLKCPLGVPERLDFTQDGSAVVLGGNDSAGVAWARFWDWAHGSVEDAFRGHAKICLSLAFTRDGGTLMSASHDGTLKLWKTETGELLHTMIADKGQVTGAGFSPDDRRIVSAGDGAVKLWDAASGSLLKFFEQQGSFGFTFFTSDGKRIVSQRADEDPEVVVWDVSDGGVLHTFPSGYFQVALAVSPINDLAAIGDQKGPDSPGEMKLVNTSNGKLIGTAPIRHSCAWPVFSPDGTKLFATNGDNIIAWDIREPSVPRELESLGEQLNHPANAAYALAISPDGRLIAVASRDGKVRLRDLATGALVRVFEAARGSMGGVIFARDGKSVIASTDNGVLTQWLVVTGSTAPVPVTTTKLESATAKRSANSPSPARKAP